jgi:hypothetical protein
MNPEARTGNGLRPDAGEFLIDLAAQRLVAIVTEPVIQDLQRTESAE